MRRCTVAHPPWRLLSAPRAPGRRRFRSFWYGCFIETRLWIKVKLNKNYFFFTIYSIAIEEMIQMPSRAVRATPWPFLGGFSDPPGAAAQGRVLLPSFFNFFNFFYSLGIEPSSKYIVFFFFTLLSFFLFFYFLADVFFYLFINIGANFNWHT